MGLGFRLGVGTWCVASCLLAADVAVVGRVVDENEAGISGARVTVAAAGSQWQVVSGPTGSFRLTVPSEGPYRFSAESQGYFRLPDQAIEVHQGMPEIHLVLNHIFETSDSVDVKASVTAVDVDQTQSERQLSGVQMMDVPYPATRSLRNALKLMPGAIEDPSGGLHFDGGAENQTLYLLDGFNIGNPLDNSFGPRLSVESIRSTDYLSGRYSPEYGKGSSGVLSIRTEVGDDRYRASATNFIPGFDTRSGLHLGSWTPRANLSGPIMKGRAWFSDSLEGEYDNPVVPGLPNGQNTATTCQAGNLLHAQFNLTPSNILFADLLVNYQRAGRLGLGALDPFPTTTDNRDRVWFYGFKDQIYMARHMLLEIGFAEQRTFDRRIPQGHDFYQLTTSGRAGNFFVDSTQNARRDQLLANLFLPSFHLAGSHQWKAGIDADRLNYSKNVRRTGFELFGVSGNLLQRTTFGGNGVFQRPSLEASSYVVDDWKLRPNLMVEAGVRQDWDELIRRVAWSPRASISWAPFGSTKTRISGGYAVVHDATTLELFTRPLDQYSLSDVYGPGGALVRAASVSLYTIQDRHLAAPNYRNWTLGADRDLAHGFHVSVSLLRKRGDHGLAYVNTLAAPIVAPPAIQAAYHASYLEGLFTLTNVNREKYDSAQVTVHQALGGRYEWMASYTRSRSFSTQVLDRNIDRYLMVADNAGPQSWDSPSRFLNWAYLPTPFKNWAAAYLLEARDGFPYSIQHDTGAVIGAANSYRFPAYFSLNLHLEWRVRLFHRRWALRGGLNNVTDHNNPTVVNNVIESPQFRQYYGSDGRHFVVRLRWLGKE